MKTKVQKIRGKTVSWFCPRCGHEQVESERAVSTFCKKCWQHYSRVESIPGGKKELGPVVGQVAPFRFPGIHGLGSVEPSAGTAVENGREVMCPNCGSSFSYYGLQKGEAQCRLCQFRVMLDDVVLRGIGTETILTGGDVIIEKAGAQVGRIFARNVKVAGRVIGAIEAWGKLEVSGQARILGPVLCRHLIVAKRARVDFNASVVADRVEVHGAITGTIACLSGLHVIKRGAVFGSVHANGVRIEKGGAFLGQLEII